MGKIYIGLAILLLLCFGVSWPTSGSLSTALYIVAALCVLLVIIPATVIGVVLLLKGGKREVKKVAESHPPRPGPTATAKHEDPHHPKKDGGGHGHDGPASSSMHWSTVLLTLAVTAAIVCGIIWGLAFVNAKTAPGATSETRFDMSYRNMVSAPAATAFDMSACPAAPENITVIAPPKGAALAAEFPIPMCYTAKLCDKARDPQCTAQEFSDTRLSVRCESAGDEPVTREFDRERDLASQTCWVQSTGPEKVVVDVIYRLKDNLP